MSESGWIWGIPNGRAYDPRGATQALLGRIEEKKKKRNYANLKDDYGLSELVLLLHYDLRGIIHNAPFEGLNWEIEDVVGAANGNLTQNAGPFDRAFLYFDYNEGRLLILYP